MPEFDATIAYRPIPSLPEAFYRAGTDGSVWSCQKKGRWAGRVGAWRRLKEVPIGRGYRGARLGVNGVHKTWYIHRLVLEAFVGPCPPGMECCHGNRDKSDNRLDNLRWDTPKANQGDRRRHGTHREGSGIPWSRLTEADIPIICGRLAAGEQAVAVARDYGVDPETVRDVARMRTWRHVARDPLKPHVGRPLTAFGETKRVAEWARDPRCVVPPETLRMRLWRGWNAEAALTNPIHLR